MVFPCLARAVPAVSPAAAVLAAGAAPARADGDPAGDVRLLQPAFFPYASPSSS